MAEGLNERRSERELLTTEVVNQRFLVELAAIKTDIMLHEGPYNKPFRYNAPEGFAHIIRLADGRPIISTTFGPNITVRHDEEDPLVISGLEGTIISTKDVLLHMHGSNRRYKNDRAVFFHENVEDILELILVETVVDDGPVLTET